MATAPLSTVVLSTQNPRATLHLSSVNTGKTRESTAIQFRDCYTGIGIRVIGGKTDGIAHGIFIKRLLKGGQALADGRLRVGDQLLRINGYSLEDVEYSESLKILREAAASGQATLVVTRDDKCRREFTALMEDEFTTHSESSRATTPLNNMESSCSSDMTLQSESSQSNHPTPKNNQSQPTNTAMNNSTHQSSLTRSLSNNSTHRQEIQRLANFFSHKLHGSTAMASTPYDRTKDSNQQAGHAVAGAAAALVSPPARRRLNAQEPADSLFAQQLYSSINPGSRHSSLQRGGGMAPSTDLRCSFEKLESALRFLGLNMSEGQRVQLRAMLHADSQGLISYSHFVQVVKHMFQDDLKNWDDMLFINTNTSLAPPSVALAPPPRTSELSPPHKPSVSAEVRLNNPDLVDEIRQLQRENFTLRKQIHTLSRQLNDQVQLTSSAEKNLHKFRAEAQHALEETTTLKEKLLLATESQKVARQQEQEFERMIEGLELEVQTLKENEAKQLESPTVRKRLAVMGSQLRKSEESRKTYQVVTQKLLDYCQYVHDAMSGKLALEPESRLTPQSLASEALETISLVRSLLEHNPLPFGWEECFNEEGTRYFINHMTHETTWHHPISRQGGPSTKRIY